MEAVKFKVKRLFNRFGFDIIHYPNFKDLQRIQLFERKGIDTIIDIGANEGQFAEYMWGNNFQGKIISVEPIKDVFNLLSLKARSNVNWEAFNFAMSDTDGEAILNISENNLSSSLSYPKNNFVNSTPEAKIIDNQNVKVFKLDSKISELIGNSKNYFIKIDAQGLEYKILNGATESLKSAKGIQLELSLNPLYDEEKTMFEILPILFARGFRLYVIENGYCEPNRGELLQVEVILFK